jgi:FAD/FMN-containing dehydrogenase
MPLAPVTPEFEARLRARLPAAAFRDFTARYREEPRGRFRAADALLVAPGNAEEVAEAVCACAAAGVGVVPYGGGTGLVAGQILSEGPAPVVLSLERMAAIRAVLPEENVLVAEAGAVLARVQDAAEAAGRVFPLSLASEGSCTVGGVLAANAGGVMTLRHGNARALCLGIEAVLPDGQIWHGLTRLRKDNAGYDLRDLLVGAEGTLGVITAASLRLVPAPGARAAAFLAVPDPAAALALLNRAGARLGPAVAAFEIMQRTGLDFLAEKMPELRLPLSPVPDWSVLIDLDGPAGAPLDAGLEALLAEAAEAGLVTDGVIAQSGAQRAAFWQLRESIPEANRLVGAVSSHDVSVPLGAIPRFIDEASAALARLGDLRVNCFGHVGDGNLHFNVFPAAGRHRDAYDPLRGAVKDTVYGIVDALGGSIAAEHGVGRLKVADLERYADPAKLAAMRAVKTALDPAGIMNPGAVLRAAP